MRCINNAHILFQFSCEMIFNVHSRVAINRIYYRRSAMNGHSRDARCVCGWDKYKIAAVKRHFTVCCIFVVRSDRAWCAGAFVSPRRATMHYATRCWRVRRGRIEIIFSYSQWPKVSVIQLSVKAPGHALILRERQNRLCKNKNVELAFIWYSNK